MHKPVVLPLGFEFRFIAGRAVEYVPAVLAISLLCYLFKPSLLWLMVAQFIIFLGLLALLSARRINSERLMIEKFATYEAEFMLKLHKDETRRDKWPPIAAILTLSILYSFFQPFPAGLFKVIAVGLLLGIGIYCRWRIYDRWLLRELRYIRWQQTRG